MTKTILYDKLENNKVKCRVCNHECLILPGKRGVCAVRENKDGILYSLNYGKVIALNIDPIEKKPLFHFLPGSRSLSLACPGCNFKCANCQNWEISQKPKSDKKVEGDNLTPEKIVKFAREKKLPSISYTYTEPTIFIEYALDVMRLAKKSGIKNVWVSNGYFTAEAFQKIAPYLDAANIDLKFFKEKQYQKYCGARLKPVLENLRRLKEKDIWLEITTLLIPGLNDSATQLSKIADFIFRLGPKIPWHISAFSPEVSWQMQDFENTPLSSLQKAHKIGKKARLKYVYIGNASEIEEQNTYCPRCNTLLIERVGYDIKNFSKNGAVCPKCNEKIEIFLK